MHNRGFDILDRSFVPFDRPKPLKDFIFRGLGKSFRSFVPFDRKSSLGAISRMERSFRNQERNLKDRSTCKSSLGAASQAIGTMERTFFPKPAIEKKNF